MRDTSGRILRGHFTKRPPSFMAAEQQGGRIVMRPYGYTISFPANCSNIPPDIVTEKGKTPSCKMTLFSI
jgi:hypothetical protein